MKHAAATFDPRHPMLCKTYGTSDDIIDAYMELGAHDRRQVENDLLVLAHYGAVTEIEKGLIEWIGWGEL